MNTPSYCSISYCSYCLYRHGKVGDKKETGKLLTINPSQMTKQVIGYPANYFRLRGHLVFWTLPSYRQGKITFCEEKKTECALLLDKGLQLEGDLNKSRIFFGNSIARVCQKAGPQAFEVDPPFRAVFSQKTRGEVFAGFGHKTQPTKMVMNPQQNVSWILY